MVKGINDIGEQSIYHFNGLGILVTNEWLIKKNAYGYHDVTAAALEQVTAQDGMDSEIIADADSNKKKVKSKKPAEEVATKPELNKTSHVIKDFVIDYNSAAQENLMEYELYNEGLTYRYVYGTDKLGVTAYTIPNGSASVTTENGEIPLYYHMDHMGSSEFLTSDVTKRITSWTSYDEWGNITHNAVLKCGTRELDLVKNYTGHERDSVLGMYYAKARMYDTADKHGSTKGNKLGDKRFMAVDPVKGNVRNPQSMVQYTYVLNNPLYYIDPLGEDVIAIQLESDVLLMLGFTGGIAVSVDSAGNFTFYSRGGVVGGTSTSAVLDPLNPGEIAKGSVTIAYSNAPTYNEFEGVSGGVYAGLGPVAVEISRSATDSSIYTIAVGGHGGLPEFGGKITKVESVKNWSLLQDYFDRFTCEADKNMAAEGAIEAFF